MLTHIQSIHILLDGRVDSKYPVIISPLALIESSSIAVLSDVHVTQRVYAAPNPIYIAHKSVLNEKLSLHNIHQAMNPRSVELIRRKIV